MSDEHPKTTEVQMIDTLGPTKGIKFDNDKLDLSLMPPGWASVVVDGHWEQGVEIFGLIYLATSNTGNKYHLRDACAALDVIAASGGWDTTTEVIKVLEFGVRKYSRDNWQLVPDAVNRYRAAARRHLDVIMRDVSLRKSCELARSFTFKADDSNCYHWAHVIANLLFLMWFDENPEKLVKPC